MAGSIFDSTYYNRYSVKEITFKGKALLLHIQIKRSRKINTPFTSDIIAFAVSHKFVWLNNIIVHLFSHFHFYCCQLFSKSPGRRIALHAGLIKHNENALNTS